MKSKFERFAVIVIVVVLLVSIGLIALWSNPQVRQTLCTLHCQHIEDDTAWEVCIGECLVEVANDQ